MDYSHIAIRVSEAKKYHVTDIVPGGKLPKIKFQPDLNLPRAYTSYDVSWWKCIASVAPSCGGSAALIWQTSRSVEADGSPSPYHDQKVTE